MERSPCWDEAFGLGTESPPFFGPGSALAGWKAICGAGISGLAFNAKTGLVHPSRLAWSEPCFSQHSCFAVRCENAPELQKKMRHASSDVTLRIAAPSWPARLIVSQYTEQRDFCFEKDADRPNDFGATAETRRTKNQKLQLCFFFVCNSSSCRYTSRGHDPSHRT